MVSFSTTSSCSNVSREFGVDKSQTSAGRRKRRRDDVDDSADEEIRAAMLATTCDISSELLTFGGAQHADSDSIFGKVVEIGHLAVR